MSLGDVIPDRYQRGFAADGRRHFLRECREPPVIPGRSVGGRFRQCPEDAHGNRRERAQAGDNQRAPNADS